MNEEDEEKCTCDQDAEEHTCPFKSDVHDDNETLCTCCKYCTHQCAMDI